MKRRSRFRRVAKWTGLVLCVLVLAMTWFTHTQPLVFQAGHGFQMGMGRFTVRILWTASGKATIAWDAVTLTPTYSIRANDFHLGFPAWLAILAVALPTAILWYRDRRPPKGHCQRCGYDLTGNVTGVCPECGSRAIRKSTNSSH